MKMTVLQWRRVLQIATVILTLRDKYDYGKHTGWSTEQLKNLNILLIVKVLF